MKQHEEVTFQTLANNEDVQIGYSDNEIVIVDSIQQFTQLSTAHVTMNAIVICTSGKAQAQMNGLQMELYKNQVAIIPQNVTVTDVMISPDFDLKGIFLTNRILRSFLNEKISVWNDMMYIHRQHIVTMDEDEILFYTHFYDMLTLAIERGKENPYHTEIIQALLRSAILGLCGEMKWMLSQVGSELSTLNHKQSTSQSHFQRFLDLLHANAGIIDIPRYIHEMTFAQWYKVININLNGMWLAAKYAITQMLKQDGGSIVFTGSNWATVCDPGFTSYAASKAAVVNLGRNLALDYAKDNIRVNVVCPGNMMTPLLERQLSTEADPEATLEAMGQISQPQEIANLVAFLLSDEASAMKGSAVTIDQGETLGYRPGLRVTKK